jgi:hypothetical protein
MSREEHMWRSRAIVREATWVRAAIVLLGALILTGCASAIAVHVPAADMDGR